MVKASPFRSFAHEESGATLAEGLIVFPLVLLVFAAFVEFGYAMFQWNQTVKALQFGARKVAVSSSMVTGFDPVTVTALASGSTNGGVAIPVGALGPWTCTGRPACTSELNRIVYGAPGATTCQAIGTGSPAMCQLNPRIGINNVRVTYMMSGLGYYGRPAGAVLTIRMEVLGITFNLPLLGALLGLNNVTVPALPVTVTSEDLNTNSGS
ncbi:pilus assembly protein [Mesorhizobium sp. B2-3-11]|uniref:TadE/TadG family type IV pilus assembly protein n=1 Tax=Mesorhizobium sp. B2-3-11 TaxID=2589953 RepID=UPI0011295254|nr:TadE/TadG family type IV pilus assembly protein [Mesorhizobium sp. B2-3-11]TPM03762.1 pilus assembly protein [Mesorhizobium sp. B2-3-11]